MSMALKWFLPLIKLSVVLYMLIACSRYKQVIMGLPAVRINVALGKDCPLVERAQDQFLKADRIALDWESIAQKL